MHPELIFLGTGGDCVAVNKRKTAGLLLRTEKSLIHLDPGPGALVELIRNKFSPRKISSILVSANTFERNHDHAALKWAATLNGLESRDLNSKKFEDIDFKEIPVKKGNAFLFRMPDCTILYTPEAQSDLPSADIIVLAGKPTKKFVTRLQPKLIILTHFGEEFLKRSPIYLARELSELGTKVIAAEDGLVVSPMDYSAGNEQKHLSKYRG